MRPLAWDPQLRFPDSPLGKTETHNTEQEWRKQHPPVIPSEVTEGTGKRMPHGHSKWAWLVNPGLWQVGLVRFVNQAGGQERRWEL